MNPLDLRGPEFLAFYVITFVIALIVAVVLRSMLRRSDGTLTGRRTDLGPLELAYLAGGPQRAVQAALVSLASRGAIAIGPKGVFQANGDASTRPGNAVESSLFQAIRQSTAARMQRLVAQAQPALNSLEAQLVGAGLVVPSGTRALAGFMTFAVLGIVMAIGAAKVVVGVQRDKAVTFLVILLIVSLIITVVIVAKGLRRTTVGNQVLKQHLDQHRPLKYAAPQADNDHLLLGVALFGPTLLAGTALADFHRPLMPVSTGGDGGTGGGCSGSSCGGGGCGGGGCGGCGGGD